MQRIRKGDEVVVITGRDLGKRGIVISPADGSKLLVEGINVFTKHVKPNPLKGVEGGIKDITKPIDRSNVMLFNPETGRGDKVAIKEVDGKKKRVFKSNGADVPSKA